MGCKAAEAAEAPLVCISIEGEIAVLGESTEVYSGGEAKQDQGVIQGGCQVMKNKLQPRT